MLDELTSLLTERWFSNYLFLPLGGVCLKAAPWNLKRKHVFYTHPGKETSILLAHFVLSNFDIEVLKFRFLTWFLIITGVNFLIQQISGHIFWEECVYVTKGDTLGGKATSALKGVRETYLNFNFSTLWWC